MLSFTSSGLLTSASSAFSWSSTSELVFAHSQATQPSLFAFCTIATLTPTPITVDEHSFESWNGLLPYSDATFEKTASLVAVATPPPSPAPSAASSWLSSGPYSLRSVASDASMASTTASSILDYSSPSPSSKRRTSRQRPSDQFEYLQYLSSSSSDEDDDSRPSTLPPTSQKILLFTRQPASPSRKMMPARVLPQYEAKWRL